MKYELIPCNIPGCTRRHGVRLLAKATITKVRRGLRGASDIGAPSPPAAADNRQSHAGRPAEIPLSRPGTRTAREAHEHPGVRAPRALLDSAQAQAAHPPGSRG